MAIDSPRPIGVLLVNLGTPEAPTTASVRAYLREFLSDPRVIDLPGWQRWLLLRAIILPFRSPKSAAAYRSIWTAAGSPLLANGLALRQSLQQALGPSHRVELGMRYGSPSLATALQALADCSRIVVLPLYPQYASSSTGSSLAEIYRLAGLPDSTPFVRVVPPFYDDPGFLRAVAERGRSLLQTLEPDRVLFSFHGLPVHQVVRAAPSHCLATASCCDAVEPVNRNCYRAQCFATARGIAAELGLSPERYLVCFQSRLGKRPWIEPHTDTVISALAERGVKRLLVFCPSFVADCLETLEEIAIRERANFLARGGEALELVPSLNAEPDWVEAVADLVKAGEAVPATA